MTRNLLPLCDGPPGTSNYGGSKHIPNTFILIHHFGYMAVILYPESVLQG